MGGLPGLVGLGGGAGGTSFGGPQAAQITNPTDMQQIGTAYTGTQNSMASQQALLQALQGQNGLANQNQVYGQLQGIASGAVNPAQAQFAQNTAQNVGNQAALMAGQRGASANTGLIARQAAMQGAGIQQQAVGQEAAQQAQNQISAIGAAGNLATTQAGQQIGQTNANTSAQQAEQQNLLNAMQGYNTNQVASQASINAANAQLANTQLQGQQALIGGVMNAGGAAAGLAGGGGGGAAAPLAAGGAYGGDLKKLAGGGWSQSGPTIGGGGDMPASDPAQQGVFQYSPNDPYNVQSAQQPQQGASSKFGQFLNKNKSNQNQQPAGPFNMAQTSSAAQLQQGASSLGAGLIKGAGALFGSSGPASTAPATPQAGDMSAQDQNLNGIQGGGATGGIDFGPGQAKGGMINDFRSGGKVKAKSPKEKAVKGGNDYANDKIPAVLSEHEIVLPRSVTLSKDPVRASAEFVAKVIAQRKGKK
jgi:hypothetical protein